MITLHSGKVRPHDHRAGAWRTSEPHDRDDALSSGFGALRHIEENVLAPRGNIPGRGHGDDEILTYVCEGALEHEDSMGRPTVLRAGDFHRMTARSGILGTEANASRTDGARVIRITFRPSSALVEYDAEQRRFCAADRRGALCVVGSPDGRRGSLRIRQDAFVYSAILDMGRHVVHELSEGRRAWLHLVSGEVTLGGVVLNAGDAAALTGERVVSLTARDQSEVLLIDLGDETPTEALGFGRRPFATKD